MKLKLLFYKRHGRTYPVKCSKNKSRHLAVKSTLSEYVKKSTVHGVAYVGDGERNCFERMWWFVIFVCSVFGACYLIYQAYRTMKENPIIESPSLTRTSMWEVPFPAVTVCPKSNLRFSSFALDKANWPDFSHDLLPDNLGWLVVDLTFKNIPIVIENLLLRRNDQNNYDILKKVLPEIEIINSFFGTSYNYVEVPFQNTITEYGACITFNMYDEKELLRDGVILSSLRNGTNSTERLWDRYSGFNNNLLLRNYKCPLRSFIRGDSYVIGWNVNDTKRISVFEEELVISFHAPDELPTFGVHSETINIEHRNVEQIEITPRLVVSEGIEHYEPEVRKCYFSNERYLKFYKSYTQNHCEMECLANYTLAKCGCIAYYLPHLGDTKICTTIDIKEYNCLHDKSTEINIPNFKDNGGRAPIDDCNCLQSCTQLSYEPVRTKTYDSKYGDMTGIFVRNKYSHISRHVRTELHSISEFFSNCGGALGLFLGVSVFSLVELLYFCTIRLYVHTKKDSANAVVISKKNNLRRRKHIFCVS